jgi:chemotaxis protein MotB
MRIEPKAREKKKPNHERWLVSYADLLTLLLALFVVLFASSTQNKYKIQLEAESIVQAFHGTPVPIVNAQSASKGVMQHQPSPVPRPVERPSPQSPRIPESVSHKLQAEVMALQQVQFKLQGMLAPLIQQKQVAMASEPLTLTISFNASALFPTGQATLMPPAATLLANVADKLKALPDPFTIVIQGYTDNQPIATAQFPSNWSLSAERAVSVVALFGTRGIDGTRLSAQGFGEFAPFASNATDAGRAQNRRVVVVIHAPDPDAP